MLTSVRGLRRLDRVILRSNGRGMKKHHQLSAVLLYRLKNEFTKRTFVPFKIAV
jgi:hypothetical protein